MRRAHSHTYDVHPNSTWTTTHAACSICGFAVPFESLRIALRSGALRPSQLTNALREWMAHATAEA